jgi:ribosome recycling factor
MSEHTDNAEYRMEKSIESLQYNFGRVRTGRANPHILDSIKVDYYGVPTPVTQLAGVKVPEASMLTIEPWDRSSLNAIEKAIRTSDLGITPSNDGRTPSIAIKWFAKNLTVSALIASTPSVHPSATLKTLIEFCRPRFLTQV